MGHFGLRENAFGVTPDPRFLFLSHTHGEAMASLVNGIDCDFGFQVLVAQPGMGKTTLLFNFLEKFRTIAHTAFLFQPQSNACELLQSVLHELGTNSQETSLRKLSEQLNQVLTRAARERRRVIVVIDEAQNLDFGVLEALRQLSNFETASSKLMQIVLAGQPQLAKRLALPEQEQLMQRISSFARLRPLALDEAQAYIDHRLATAGYQGPGLLNADAVRAIWEYSRGVPRQINTLSFNAMLLAFAEQAKAIDGRIVKEAVRELDLNSVIADLYQLDPPADTSTGPRRVQPIRETNPSEGNTSGTAVSSVVNSAVNSEVNALVNAEVSSGPAAAQPSSSRDAVAVAPAVQPGNRGADAAGQNAAPPVPIRVQSGAAAGPQPIAPAGKAVVLAQLAAAAPRPSTAQPRVAAVDVKAAPKEAPANSSKTANPAKNSAPKTIEPMAALAAVPPQKKPVEKTRSDSRAWWAKALALTAITGILAFVLGQQFSAPRSGQVEANGAGGSSPTPSGYAAPNAGSASPSEAPSASTRKNIKASSDADTADDVTVRKFPTDSDAAADSPDKGQKLETIFFAQDSAIIDAQYGTSLRRIADALAENPGASAILEGHTDDTGPETYNLDLSSRRAIAVRNALVDELHVPITRLAAVGAGAASPAQPNSSATGRAYNRRVEVRLVHLGQ